MSVAVDTPKGRYYLWGDTKFISVTTGISEGLSKPGLNKWYVKNIADVAARNRKKLYTMTQAEAKEWLLSHQFPDDDGDSAAVHGSKVHAMCEALANGRDVKDTEKTRPYTDAFRLFMIEQRPTFLETEATVYSLEHGYAGTMDAIIKVRRKTYVVDIKTGKSVWPEAALQISAYRYADFIGRPDGRTDPIPACNGGLVLHLRPEGYEVIPVSCGPEVFDTFLSTLDIFRWNSLSGKAAIGERW